VHGGASTGDAVVAGAEVGADDADTSSMPALDATSSVVVVVVVGSELGVVVAAADDPWDDAEAVR
jgi:hypothetical protein